MSLLQKTGCASCGAPLQYLEAREPMRCAMCQQEHEADARCVRGHFVCDACHAADPVEVILTLVRSASTRDPVALATQAMSSPRIPMHGPEHHFLVPASLIAAACEAAGKNDERERLLQEARKRSAIVRGGFCGFFGTCGAAVGVGIFASLWYGTNPLSKEGWKTANGLTARILATIAAAGGPRCCKRDTYLAVRGAAEVAREDWGIAFDVPERIVCTHHLLNRECLGPACSFHPEAGT
jgi:LSD1 subclass zinc finger protein